MRALDSHNEKASMHDVLDRRQDTFVQKRSGQAELMGVGQAGHTVRCKSVLQVRVEPKSQ